jgi:hypothetical protein
VNAVQPGQHGIGPFARALLALAERRAEGSTSLFRMPEAAVSVRCDDAAYLANCRRALIDEAGYGDGPAIEVTAVNRPDRGQLPRPVFAVEAVGLGDVFRQLEAIGLRGSYDTEHAIWQLYDPARRIGVQVASNGTYPPWEVSFPLRNFLHWRYESLGLRLVHGATLGVDGVGILLCGEGGAGKSGTTLGGMMNGLTSVGDDYVVIDPRGAVPKAFPVMRLMKQDAGGLARLGFDLGNSNAVGPNWQDKYELDLGDQPPGSRVRELSLAAIVLPRLAGGAESRLTPATQKEAMMALAPSTLRQLPGTLASGLGFMAGLARRLPSYHLELSADAAEITSTIRRLIAEVAR